MRKRFLCMFFAAGMFAASGAYDPADQEELPRPPRDQYLVERQFWTGPMPKLPDETQDVIYLGSSPTWLFASDNAMTSSRRFRELFPDTQLVHSACWFPHAGTEKMIAEFEALGIFYQQQHAPPRDFKNLEALAPLATNYRGDRWLGESSVVVFTEPRLQEYINSKIYNGAKYGNNSFKVIDFVWPWTGRWAYDPVTVSAFRDDLVARDEGLLLRDADGRFYRQYFWDYFEFYRGLRFTPQELGYVSWDEFVPPFEIDCARPDASIELKRRLTVFIALYHYEHLRQHQRLGRAAKAVGGTHQATYNPEDFANGGDYVYILKLADFGTPFFEYFGSPINTEGAFYHMGAFHRAARSAGKPMGVIHELGQNGHGDPSVSALTQFVQTYDITAMGFDQYQNEWMADEASQMLDPAYEYQNRRWRTFLGGAYGYKQARGDRAFRPKAPVLSVTLRSVNHYMDAWSWDVKSMDSFCRYFSPIHVDAEETYPGELESLLPDTEYLFYTAPYTRKADFERISDWLSRGKRKLVTHSYIPCSIDEGIEYQLDADRIAQAQIPKMIMEFMRFPGVTDTVIYRGENYSYADFLAREIRSPFQTASVIAPEFSSLRREEKGIAGEAKANGVVLGKVDVPQYWSWTPEGGRVLATVSDKPLVTRLDRADGSVIVYLHVRLHLLDEALRQAVTSLIADELALPRLALPVSTERRALLHSYQLPEHSASAAILWDRKALEARGYYAGYRPREEWTLENRFNYNMPDANGAVRYRVPEAGNYRIYQFVAGVETVAAADADRTVTLALDGQLCDLYYIGMDTPEWRTRLNEIKARRDIVRANVGDQ